MDTQKLGRRALMDAAAEVARKELPEQQYFNTPAAGTYLGNFTRKQLESWRSHGSGPPFIRVGRHVRYCRAALDAWMAARTVTNTAQEVPR